MCITDFFDDVQRSCLEEQKVEGLILLSSAIKIKMKMKVNDNKVI